MKIITKDIAGYEGVYSIDNIGRVFSKHSKRYVFGRMSKNGYQTITLKCGNKITSTYVHRLVAMHFIKNAENKPQVNHIDGIKTNNIVSNLEWVTAQENILHSYKIGRIAHQHKYSKDQKDFAVELRKNGYTFNKAAQIAGCSAASAKRAYYKDVRS